MRLEPKAPRSRVKHSYHCAPTILLSNHTSNATVHGALTLHVDVLHANVVPFVKTLVYVQDRQQTYIMSES